MNKIPVRCSFLEGCRRFIFSAGPSVLLFVIVVFAVEMMDQFELLNTSLFPSPTLVIRGISENATDFRAAFVETWLHSFYGFLLSFGFGVTIACFFSMNDFLRRSLFPYAIFFQTVPIIAIAPLYVIYFGFGAGTVIACSASVAVFPVLASTLIGLSNTSKSQKELFQIMNASPWQEFVYLKLPAAYISVYSGLKVSVGLSVIGVVIGEFVAGGGLGAMIDSARTQQRIDLVYASLLLLAIVGLSMNLILQLCHRALIKWRPLSAEIGFLG